jgi:eukaryotic-like serine/threonine-protein kinase
VPTEAFGPYLVYEQLGMGGMARVDRAAHTGIEGFQRPIALKRMLPHVAANDDMVKAFVREAMLARHLRHSNVAQTYELGKVDGVLFIAMELVTGPTLRAVLKHCAQTTGPMPVPVALNILNQICDALDYAHNLCDESGQPLGIIHRDVSPSNIIIDEAGVAKLIDFGIAKASAAGMQTMSGTIKGKFGYMAPEYLEGQIDARADLFAVGVIAHELLTNRPLFSVADDMETLRRVRAMPLKPPSASNPNVPAEIDDVVMTALSRKPEGRWQHATALRTAMTTLTKRLGMICTNQQAVEWITWAFTQVKTRSTRRATVEPPAREPEPAELSVQIEVGTRSDLPHGASAASSQKLTLMMDSPPEPPTLVPLGTPSRAIVAQPGDTLGGEEYRAAVAAYEGLASAPRNTDDVRTTLLRPSAPRLEAPAATDPRPRNPSNPPRARSSSDPGYNTTLLDGAAALRSRSSSHSVAPPVGSSSGPLAALAPARPSQPMPQPMPMMQPMPIPLSPLPALTPRAPAGLELRLPEPAPPERRSSAALVVVLVLLAAGLAAAGVYLVLPLLT